MSNCPLMVFGPITVHLDLVQIQLIPMSRPTASQDSSINLNPTSRAKHMEDNTFRLGLSSSAYVCGLRLCIRSSLWAHKICVLCAYSVGYVYTRLITRTWLCGSHNYNSCNFFVYFCIKRHHCISLVYNTKVNPIK